MLPVVGPLDRSFWPSPHHSYLHDRVRLRHCLLVPVALWVVAVLRDLLRAGSRRERCRSSGLLAIDFHLVPSTLRDGAGLCDGWGGFGRNDFTGRCPVHHQPVWLARRLWITQRFSIAPRLAP